MKPKTQKTPGSKASLLRGKQNSKNKQSSGRKKGSQKAPRSRTPKHNELATGQASSLRGRLKKTEGTEAKKSSSSAKTMEELLAKTESLKTLKQGGVVEGVVTEVSKKMVLLDIGAKTEGMVVDREYEGAYEIIRDMRVGDKVKAIVISQENDRGQILLSLRRAASDKSWDHYNELMESDSVLIVRGLEVNKGGLIVRADGTRGFIPSSQFTKAWQGKLEELINRPIKVKVIEVDKEKNRLIFSERHVSEAEALDKKAEALKAIEAGDNLEGIVSGVMPFGAFVTVKVPLTGSKLKAEGLTGEAELEGLVHISEISWEKVADPNNYFKTGQAVKVQVLSIDKDAGKLNLSVKRLLPDPWKDIAKKYKLGSKHAGKVTRVEQFGAFVNFEPGVDGLIHISKIPAGEEPVVDQKLDVYVETLDPEHRRMSLSMVLKTTEKLIYK